MNLEDWIRQRESVMRCVHPCAPDGCVCDLHAALRRAKLLEELAALSAGGVQAKAAAEVQRLKALANLPIIDTARLDDLGRGERWEQTVRSVIPLNRAGTGDDILVATPAAAPSAGRWLRCPGAVDLALPIAFGTADGAVLLTIPTGARFKLESAHWEVTTGFTGGSSSAIGVASSLNATAGDILGGAGGDVTATLGTAGIKTGTIGAIMDTDAELHAQMYVAASNFTFERVTSAFTAGAGYVHLVGTLLRNAGS